MSLSGKRMQRSLVFRFVVERREKREGAKRGEEEREEKGNNSPW